MAVKYFYKDTHLTHSQRMQINKLADLELQNFKLRPENKKKKCSRNKILTDILSKLNKECKSYAHYNSYLNEMTRLAKFDKFSLRQIAAAKFEEFYDNEC